MSKRLPGHFLFNQVWFFGLPVPHSPRFHDLPRRHIKCYFSKKTCMDFLRVVSCIQSCACAVVVLRRLEQTQSLRILQECSTQKSLSSASASTPKLEDMSSSPCVPANLRFDPQQWVRLSAHTFHFVPESNSQTVAPTSVDGLFKGFRSFLRALTVSL